VSAGAAAEHRFSVLGFTAALRGPAATLEPVRAAYRRFERAGVAPDVVVEISAGAEPWLAVGGERQPLVPGIDPTAQLYQRLLVAVMDGIGTHAILHAAALASGDGGVTLIAAPSGYGKSSLALELVSRGHGFLGDDYAPVELATGRVFPYPRAVGVVPGGTAPLPAAIRRAAEDARAPRLLGKVLVDVGEALGEAAVVRTPGPLHRVVLLGAPAERAPGAAPTWVRVMTRATDAAHFDGAFSAIEGVEVVRRQSAGGLARWLLRLGHEHEPTAEVTRVLDDPRVLASEKHWEGSPDFDASPEVERIARSDAARWLGRELLNRRPGGRLLASYGGRLTGLFLDLAAVLHETECWRVQVGRAAATADVIESLTGAPSRRV
jgi:hypothetical protein